MTIGEIKDSNRDGDEPVYYSRETSDQEGRERGLEDYESYLGLKREDLDGKDVLDLGSGETEKFSRELKEAGINANVIPLNPDASMERFRKKLEATPGYQGKTVAALAQKMPFKDESFDEILGLYSVTVHAAPAENMQVAKQWMSEIIRLLKPGGEARLAPVEPFAENEQAVRSGKFGELIRDLENKGLICEIVIIKNIAFRRDENGKHLPEIDDIYGGHSDARLVIKKAK